MSKVKSSQKCYSTINLDFSISYKFNLESKVGWLVISHNSLKSIFYFKIIKKLSVIDLQ